MDSVKEKLRNLVDELAGSENPIEGGAAVILFTTLGSLHDGSFKEFVSYVSQFAEYRLMKNGEGKEDEI